jgi:hypothetical protein
VLEYYRRSLDDGAVHRRWIDPRLCRTRVKDIQAYLLKKGWKPVPPDRPHVLVFEEPVVEPEGPLYQWVPENEQARDYPARIYELLAGIADFEDRPAGDVLTDILAQAAVATPVHGPGAVTQAEPATK